MTAKRPGFVVSGGRVGRGGGTFEPELVVLASLAVAKTAYAAIVVEMRDERRMVKPALECVLQRIPPGHEAMMKTILAVVRVHLYARAKFLHEF